MSSDKGAAALRRTRAADRGSALASLSEGLAHALRNPLTGISSGVEFLGRQMARDPVQQENVAAVLHEVRRLNGLLEDLVRITHPPRLDLRPVALEAALQELAREAATRFPEVRLEARCEPRVGRPRLDASQVRGALRELLSNAAQAAPPGSTVSLSAALEPPGAEQADLGDPLLRVDVVDRGPGVPPPVRQARFEPFRTTRPGAKGLGLYIAHDIAARHGGELRLADEAGGGTRATLYLPWEIGDDDGD
ncbi:MAG TPA: ATP-binding protein [Candidatus Saccharimonadales bacterium]|nr:ATP-binding protein [Candidatus Saccharimonadales bacterium]